jgi:hypothetical protein
MMVGFVRLLDEHATSVKYRVRRVLHAQRTDPMKPPRSAPPAGLDHTLLPIRPQATSADPPVVSRPCRSAKPRTSHRT